MSEPVPTPETGGGLSIKEAAALMGVSVRSVYLAGELQRCNRPDLEAQCLAGTMTIRQALRIAKPEKYGKRDKVDQWVSQFAAWDRPTQIRAIEEMTRRGLVNAS